MGNPTHPGFGLEAPSKCKDPKAHEREAWTVRAAVISDLWPWADGLIVECCEDHGLPVAVWKILSCGCAAGAYL